MYKSYQITTADNVHYNSASLVLKNFTTKCNLTQLFNNGNFQFSPAPKSSKRQNCNSSKICQIRLKHISVFLINRRFPSSRCLSSGQKFLRCYYYYYILLVVVLVLVAVAVCLGSLARSRGLPPVRRVLAGAAFAVL